MRRVFVLVAVMLTAGCTSSHHDAARQVTGPHVTAPAGAALPDGCGAGTTSPTTGFGSIHTIPPRTEPVFYEVAVSPKRVCLGGQVRVAVRIVNLSAKEVTVAPPLIIGREYLPGCCDEVRVPGKGERTIVQVVTVPDWVPLGHSGIGLRNFNPDARDRAAEFEIVGP